MIDAARGAAVLAMIEWHAADAWIGAPTRDGAAFGWLQLVGGLAAPAFVLLAGVGLALATPERPTLSQSASSVRRAVRIVLAGYALSLFSWAVDHGGVLERAELGPICAATVGLAALASATADPPRSVAVRAGLGTAGLAAMHLAWSRLDGAGAQLARLDVLHGIGAALVVTALALHALGVARTRSPSRRTSAAVLGALAVAVSGASVWVEGAPQRVLPASIAAWIARAPGDGPGFPLFPWAAYALLGAALAIAARQRSADARSDRWIVPEVPRSRALALLAASTAVALLSWESGPVASAAIEHALALRGPFRLAFNASVVLATCGALAAIGPAWPRAGMALALLGRRSLVVYCVHLELVYGLAGLPLARALGLGGWSVGVITVAAAMVWLARAIERASWRARQRDGAHVHAVA